MPQLETEYAYVRVNRMEAGEILPAQHPRRCRYFVRALNRKAAETKIDTRWPNEPTEIVSSRDVPVLVFPQDTAPSKTAAANTPQIGGMNA